MDGSGGTVFVHCANCSNRSPTLAVAYVAAAAAAVTASAAAAIAVFLRKTRLHRVATGDRSKRRRFGTRLRRVGICCRYLMHRGLSLKGALQYTLARRPVLWWLLCRAPL